MTFNRGTYGYQLPGQAKPKKRLFPSEEALRLLGVQVNEITDAKYS